VEVERAVLSEKGRDLFVLGAHRRKPKLQIPPRRLAHHVLEVGLRVWPLLDPGLVARLPVGVGMRHHHEPKVLPPRRHFATAAQPVQNQRAQGFRPHRLIGVVARQQTHRDGAGAQHCAIHRSPLLTRPQRMEGGDVIVPHTGFPDERPCGIVRAKGRGRIDEGRESRLHVL